MSEVGPPPDATPGGRDAWGAARPRAVLLFHWDAADEPSVPRPSTGCGYRLRIARAELWASRPHRLHDRVAGTRALEPSEGGFAGGPWQAERLQP